MRKNFKFQYVNHLGAVLDLSGAGIDADGSGLPSWSFEAITLNNRIAGLKRTTPVYTIPLIVIAESAQAGIAAKNALHEIPAVDVDAQVPGRLYFNDWYITGYVTASIASNFWQLKRAAQYELTFTATTHDWVREVSRTYTKQNLVVGDDLDFPHDYEHDYMAAREIFTVENENYSESPILLRIFGNVDNPRITINGNVYGVDVPLNLGEYVEVDGLNKTVTLVLANGERRNAFNKAAGDFRVGSGSYIFQPLPVGASEVVWSGEFDFDLVSFELRGEPRWS